jgi:hypothetical protein
MINIFILKYFITIIDVNNFYKHYYKHYFKNLNINLK